MVVVMGVMGATIPAAYMAAVLVGLVATVLLAVLAGLEALTLVQVHMAAVEALRLQQSVHHQQGVKMLAVALVV